MLNTETVLKLIDKGFTHDEIMAFNNQTEPQTEPKEDPKTEPVPKEDPKTEPVPSEPKTEPVPSEPKEDVTGKDILNAILALGKQVQSSQAMGQRLPELKDLTADDVVAQLIRPTRQGEISND